MARGFARALVFLVAVFLLVAGGARADNTLSLADGNTVTGSFVYDPTTNSVVSYSFTSTAYGLSSQWSSSTSSGSVVLSNQDGDQVFAFDEGQSYGAIGELDIVISCGGVLNCAEQASNGNSFAIAAGYPPCPNAGTTTGYCIASGDQYSVPECLGTCEDLINPGNFITITDPPAGDFTFTLSTTSTGTVFSGGGTTGVPEPSTLVLSALGLAAFALKRACS